MSMSLIEEARAHAAEEPDSAAEDVGSVADLVALFARLRRDGVRLEYLDFHTHGGDGEIGIGSEALYDWSAFIGFQDVFANDARIEFHGCNVADGPDGEFFLVDCGSTQPKRGGGSVAGHAGLALALRALRKLGTAGNSNRRAGSEYVSHLGPD
jgi:hypothetical protein